MQEFTFYHQHLEQVSRSFSFCISVLTSPAKEWVALSYLLFRIVDTIEDSNWGNSQEQFESFETFKLFLVNNPSEKLFLAWAGRFPKQIAEAERNLIMDLPLLLKDLGRLPHKMRQELIKITSQVIDGMSYFLRQYKKGDVIILHSLASMNQYCFFVAGIVGQLLTRIFTYCIEDFSWSTRLLNQSIHFGLFLQKINLLKDQMSDEHSGRYYISSRMLVRESLVMNARYAMDYLKSIPVLTGRPYRLFCAWSLFIGLASLKWIDKNWQLQQEIYSQQLDPVSQRIYKIKTSETNYLIRQVIELIDDNHALEKLFNRYFPGGNNLLQFNPSHQEVAEIPIWLRSIYAYEPDAIDWFALGICVLKTA